MSDSERSGKGLNVFSYAIIIYLWSDANFNEQGIFFGGGVTFNRPEVLEVAAMLAYAMFILRFIQPLNMRIRRARSEWHQFFERPFNDYLWDFLEDHPECIQNRREPKEKIDKSTIQRMRDQNGTIDTIRRRIALQGFKPTIEISLDSSSKDHRIRATFHASTLTLTFFWLVASGKQILLGEQFYEQIFPLLLASFATSYVVRDYLYAPIA